MFGSNYMISASKQHVKHLFAGQNTQQICITYWTQIYLWFIVAFKNRAIECTGTVPICLSVKIQMIAVTLRRKGNKKAAKKNFIVSLKGKYN